MAIIAENVVIGSDCKIGDGVEAPNKLRPDIYAFGLATIGEDSVVPSGVTIGRNTAISGITDESDYPGGCLASGENIMKAGERYESNRYRSCRWQKQPNEEAC